MMFYLTFTICTKFKLSKNLDNHHSELKWVNLKFKVSSPPYTTHDQDQNCAGGGPPAQSSGTGKLFCSVGKQNM